MSDWHHEPMLAFDLETTGPHPDTARIVTATLVEVSARGVDSTRDWLLNPGIEIPAGAAEIHGITTERAVAEGSAPEPAVHEITAHIHAWLATGRPVVAFNAAFDFTVLDRECRRHGVRSLGADPAPIIDPFVIDKHVDRYRKGKRILTVTCDVYGVAMTDAHTSAGDALGAVRIAFALAERYRELRVDLATLHERQRTWREQQSVSLAEHFARQGNFEFVNGDWPVQGLPFGWTTDLVDVDEPAAVS